MRTRETEAMTEMQRSKGILIAYFAYSFDNAFTIKYKVCMFP